MSTMNQPEVMVQITAAAATEVMKFIDHEGGDPKKGGLRGSVQPGGPAALHGGGGGVLLTAQAAAQATIEADAELGEMVAQYFGLTHAER